MRKRTMIAFIGILSVLLVMFIAFSSNKPVDGIEPENENSLGIPVEVFQVKNENIQEALNYMGTVKSKNQAELAFKMAGVLVQILVAEGDHFTNGQVLAELNIEDLTARYNVTQQKVASARLNVDYLKDQSDKNKMLYDEGAVSYQQFLDSQYKYELAEVGYQEALAVARELEVSMNSGRIYAPYDGKVRQLLKQEGEMIQPGQSVFSVSEKDDLIVEIAVIEKDLSAVAIGDKAVLHINREDTTELVEAAVTAISPVLNPQTRTANVEIIIPSGYEYMLPNMSVSVTLVKGEKTNAIVVPTEALIEHSGVTAVYVCQDGVALAREVKVGLDNGISIEITEGLDAGEYVILSVPMNLKDGDKVFVYKGVEED